MFKVTYARKEHYYSQFVGLGYGLGIAYASAGLHYGSDSVLGGQGHGIIERKESVGCEDKSGLEPGSLGLFEGDVG